MKRIKISGSIGPDGFGAADLAEALSVNDQVMIVVNSDGGCIRAAGAIADLIDEYKLPVEIRRAVSAAAIVAVAGPERSIAADGYIGIHPAWRALAGGHLELQAAAEGLREIDAMLAEMLAKRSGLAVEDAEHAIRRGRVWTAQEALADGLADRIGPARGLDIPPERIVDGPDREHHTLRERAKHHHLRGVREREIHSETTGALDGVDRAMAALVEAYSPPARLADIYHHAAGAAIRPHLEPALPRWRCTRCNLLNFQPPAIGLQPAACFHCKATQE